MKKSIRIILGAALMAVAAMFTFTSCDDNTYYDSTEMSKDTFTVEAGAWVWNADEYRFEYIFDYNKIDRDIIDYGTVEASVYLTENGVQTLTALPFVQFYQQANTPYQELIGYNIANRSIAFYIHSSDPALTEQYLSRYVFKVVVFRRVY